MADVERSSENSQEIKVGSPEAAREQQEKLANKSENAIESSPRDADMMAERAREAALETAISVEAGSNEKAKKTEPTVKRRGSISKKQKDASFKRQMKEIQAKEPPVSRAFSKVIHNKVVEKTSDVVGATVARPNAILAGAFTAFVLTLAIYVTAKIIGYELSGFETIGAFIVGWVIGVIYDYLRVVITGKK